MWDWVLLIFVGLLTTLYWYLNRINSYWKSLGIYSAPGALPGAGHLWDAVMLKKSSRWIHSEIYSQTKGHPAVGVYSFREPMLLLRDPDLVQTVMISDFSSFHDNTFSADEKIDFYLSKNPFVLKGKRWKDMRQQLAPALSPAKVKNMFPLIQRVCQEYNKYMAAHLNEEIDVHLTTGLFMSDVVAKCAFGLDTNAFNDSKSEFYKQGKHLWNSSLYNPMMMLLFEYFPIFNKIFKKSFFCKEVVDFFASIIRQTMDYRKQNPDKVADDYIQYMINLQNKTEGLTIDDIVAQSLTFFSDGFETSTIMSTFALYELTMNQELQEAARKEVKALESFSYENIMALPLLDRVIQESLRKYPAFSFEKTCTKDCTLKADGKFFPVHKGQTVIVPVFGLHHDPEIYPDPEKFDPDRFLPENVSSRHPATHLGFGIGPRICIGNRFAMCQMKMLMANVLANFQLVRCNKTVDRIKMSPAHSVPVSENKIWVLFQKL